MATDDISDHEFDGIDIDADFSNEPQSTKSTRPDADAKNELQNNTGNKVLSWNSSVFKDNL